MKFVCVLPILFISTLLLQHEEVQGTVWKLSEEEDFEFEEQLKRLNKLAVKTIHNVDGDKYDCVEFYKQPSFDHLSLQNYTFDLNQMKSFPEAYKKGENMFSKSTINTKLKGGKCPTGTVPIRRSTKDDLIRERRASKFRTLVAGENPDAHYAVSRTINSPKRFAGASGTVSIWKPIVSGLQYSASRLLLKNGPDSIEVGWRVDPVLFGDDKCRMFIRTTINNSSFIGLRRPGFVVEPGQISLEKDYEFVSQRGGKIQEAQFFIIRDGSGNWVLYTDVYRVGHWPRNIFSDNGLTQLASYIEWGGEVFSPKGTPKPPMGSGGILMEDPKLDCTFYRMAWLNEEGKPLSASELETSEDSADYKIIDAGNKGDKFGERIFFGGPSGN